MTTLNIQGLNPDDDRNMTAISYISIAWDELSDEFKVQVLAQLYDTINASQRDKFLDDAEELDNKLATARFVELIEQHEGDTESVCGSDSDEYFIPFENAFHDLMMEKGAIWAESHDWEFNDSDDAEPINKYDVRIY